MADASMPLEMPDGWSGDATALRRTFRFRGFAEAMGFMVEVAIHCDHHDHHPDWTNVYDRVSVTLTTHDAGGVTEKDIALARHMNAVHARRS